MAGRTPPEPPFDPRWLDELTALCRRRSLGNPRLEDLYLERRLELRFGTTSTIAQLQECRTDGVAARWYFPNRTVLTASSGVSNQTVADLLSRYSERSHTPAHRPAPAPDLDPPRGWRAWAEEVVGQSRRGELELVCMDRQAVVVRNDGWTVVAAPSLVRVQVRTEEETSALLAVWGHPLLGHWLAELRSPAPSRRWSPPSGLRVPVLLTAGTAGVLFHEVVGHPAEADLVLSGGSPLAGLRHATVAAPTVGVVDDPSRFDLPGAFSSDDEGVSTRPLEIVRGGQLATWLCDRDTAARVHAEPGRGRRAAWDRAPAPRVSNLVLAAGNEDPEAMEASLRRGLVVTRLGGATVDPVSGRLVLRVERGFEVVNGRRRRPLAPFELIGGALEVMAHLDPALGSDPTCDWRLGWCIKDGAGLPTGSEAPSLLAQRLEVL